MRAALLVALCLSGCAAPTCAPSALGELRTHVGYALEDLSVHDVIDAPGELAVALGLEAHPPLLRGTLVADSAGYAAVDYGAAPGSE